MVMRLQRVAGNAAVAGVVGRVVDERQADDHPPSRPDSRHDTDADHGPDRSVASTAEPVAETRAGRPGAAGVIRVQRHSSWEHRLLGDVDPRVLQVITRANEYAGKPWYEKLPGMGGKPLASDQAAAVHALQEQLEILRSWQASPPSAAGTWRGLRVVVVKLDEGDEVACTLGEVNTLADYFGNLGQLKRARKSTLTSILQTVRRDSWLKLHGVLAGIDKGVAEGLREPAFEGALTSEGSVRELGLERLTMDGRNKASETYLANASRNACHFAPQSWFRWKEHHEQARTKAKEARGAKVKADKEGNASLERVAGDLGNEAILINGFGDHYLQDSFASGHLINKTLIMQWFVEWLGQQNLAQELLERGTGRDTSKGARAIKDWDRVRRMTTSLQSDLAGIDLYDKPASGRTSDPQSAEEEATRAERIARLGLRGADQEAAYGDYLAMIDNAAIQFATKELHDHFCVNGLDVLAGGTSVGRIYGDDNMIKGGEGVGFSAETSRMSQGAITDLIEGRDPMPVTEIMARLPDQVQLGEEVVSLKEWHTGGQLRAFCEAAIFPKVRYNVMGRLSPGLGVASRDLPGGEGAAVDPASRIDEWIEPIRERLPDPAAIRDRIEKTLTDVRDRIADLARRGGARVAGAAASVKERALGAWESLGETASGVADDVRRLGSGARDEIESGLRSAEDRLEKLRDVLPTRRLRIEGLIENAIASVEDVPTEVPAEPEATGQGKSAEPETPGSTGPGATVEGPF
jgi:hypothetical protein